MKMRNKKNPHIAQYYCNITKGIFYYNKKENLSRMEIFIQMFTIAT